MYYENHPYHRHHDGTFQIDRYRTEAAAMRRQAIYESSRLTSFAKLVVVVGILLGMVALAPIKQGTATDATALRSSASQTASHGAPVRPPVF